MKRPTLKLARRTDSGGIELRVTADRRMRRWAIGLRCTAEQWNEAAGRFTSRYPDHAQRNAVLSAVLRNAERIVDELVMKRAWSWAAFDTRYSGGGEVSMPAFMARVATEAEARGSLGVGRNYRHSARMLARHSGNDQLPIEEVTPEVLARIDAGMRADGANDGGVSTVMRDIRAALNRAMKEGLLAPERYPFATQRTAGYEMKNLRRRTIPRALTEVEMDRIKRMDLHAHPHLAFAVRIFLISYYARGINFTDLADLRTEHVVGGRIYYRRRKTIGKVDRVLSIPIGGELERLLREVGPGTGGYLLPILGAHHRTPRQRMDRKHKVLGQVNAALKEVATLLDIPGTLTTYVARHTYATTLKRRGVEVAKISEAMGHTSTDTTEIYLAQFADHVLDATDRLL